MSGQGMVKRQRGHKARLELTCAQSALLDGQASAAITVWNCLHAYWTHFSGRRPTLAQADQAIRQARADFPFLAVLPAQAAQAVLKTYRQAWENFFNPDHPAKRPTFKSRKNRPRLAVDVPQVRTMRIVRLSAKWGAVTLPMVGRVRFRWTHDLPGVGKNSPAGKVTGGRLIKEADGWHLVFRTETLVAPTGAHQGPQVGIDRGVNVALALSDGTMREHGSWLTCGEREHLRRLEKKSARRRASRPKKTRPSGRERRTYHQIARLRAKAKRRAVDWQHQTTTELAGAFAVIKVEELSILNMVRSAKGTIEAPGRNVTQKAGLNRSISGEAWGRTVTLLEYKTIDRGGQVIKVPAPGTSQTCHRCGHRDAASRNGIVFACVNPACRWVGHADTNAAININNADGSAVSGRGDLGVARSAKRQPPRTA
ncbi:RNA-guided endonuclease InsQ/TnpB family protein [Streptosporangium sp. NBC_01756]|uniref:RNA-guided endonuclease InsQ/TnpB family protein n=1 Tax=Streptosporangium sp. NBC_01756 TaxID=2975950 RepID=UPI002DDBA744|nr:transposase [Streptosporangium sp. NBC_01756]WSC87946.1 transposase [Streptosporangium sp. NBC_01756]